jgi:ABC-type branched-subunit amino acid transport system substrate-binding protein
MSEIRIGGLGPLSLPGLVWAGRDLLDGMNLAVMHLNAGPPVLGGRMTLFFQDTLGERRAGVAAVKKLIEQGAHAFAGEFHSMVADAIVEPIQQTGLPFICASATMDSITARRLSCVFRLCPPQSHGWRIFADFLFGSGRFVAGKKISSASPLPVLRFSRSSRHSFACKCLILLIIFIPLLRIPGERRANAHPDVRM